MKEFNKDSYEYIKASVEVQQLLKYEADTRVGLSYHKLK